MKNVLANDGLDREAVKKLEENGFSVSTEKVSQENLIETVNEKNIDVLLVRSATKVRKDVIDKCPNLKVIGRAGVGMDNIDVSYARKNSRTVINTPLASSLSVAELVFAHIFSVSRFLHDSNRKMPLEGDRNFSALKKSYSKGKELSGKTIGIIGFGNIGQAVAKIALGLGMNIIPFDIDEKEVDITIKPHPALDADGKITARFNMMPIDTLLKESDYITVHAGIPPSGNPIVTKEWFEKMKDGVVFIHAARGGVVDEEAMIKALNTEKVLGAGLDVFANEPNPPIKILMDNRISLTPHTGASTLEAQQRIGIELAEKVIAAF